MVDASAHLLTPGFVNVHCHSESIILRFVTGQRPFAEWPSLAPLREAIATLRSPAVVSRVAELYTVAGVYHLLGGTTSLGEYPLPYEPEGINATLTGLARGGVRHRVVLQEWEQIAAARARPDAATLFTISLGPEEAYTVYSFENLLRAAREIQCPLTAHIGEQRRETDTLRRNFKKAPLAVLNEFGALSASTQILHANHLGGADLDAVRDVDGTMTLCACSGATKQTGYPVFTHLTSHDVRLSLGTDWGVGSILGEIKFLRALPQLAPGVRRFQPTELLRMGTINGAHALGIAHQTGSLEVGKKADLVMFALDDLRLPPLRHSATSADLASFLVDHIGPAAITDVMVDGRFLIRNRRPGNLDEAEIRQHAQSLYSMLVSHTPMEEVVLRAVKSDRVSLEEPSAFLRGPQSSSPDPDPAHRANLEPPTAAPPPARTSRMPELSRTVKKVFGEDDAG
ncbi:MAG: amidohydrolase family protein [Bacteroidota bacterium]